MPPKKSASKKPAAKKTAIKKPAAKKAIPVKELPKGEPAIEVKADDEEEDTEIEYVGDEEVDFTEKMLEMYQSQIKFHIFDPKTYKNETHKEVVIVYPQNRMTSEFMTKFEYAEIVSQRARQIENGAPVFVDIGLESDPIKMAEMEILQKKCPLSIRRMYNDYIGEIWHVNELSMPLL